MNKTHHDMIKDFRNRLIVSIVLTIPILIFSDLIQNLFNYGIDFVGMRWIVLTLSAIIYLYGGWVFIKGMVSEFKNKRPGMMTLIFMAITVSFTYSAIVTFGVEGKEFYWELATLIDIMLLGHLIEMRSVQNASKALENLSKLIPDIAHRKKNDRIEDVNTEELKENDIIIIKPGEKVPADGLITGGEASVNQSLITGESEPIRKTKKDELIAGSINLDGTLEMKISRSGEETYLSKVMRLVKESQKSKSKSQNLADKAAFWLTILALGVGIITVAVWLIIGKDFAFSMERAVTVMVITCPHALGLAIPLVVSVSTTLTAKNGILIRNRTPFENLKNINVIVFDKTGTLTEGRFELNHIEVVNTDFSENDILSLSASLENRSEHPIAQAIVRKAQNLDFSEPDTFHVMNGIGVKGTVDGRSVKIVNEEKAKEVLQKLPQTQKRNQTPIYVIIDDQLAAVFYLSDSIRPSAKQSVEWLRKNSIESRMLTGDHHNVAEEVAKDLNLDGYFAQVLPDQKHQKIKELKKDGKIIAMVGDGINDAPALSEADIGIAIGGGTDIAAESADIILADDDLNGIVKLIRFSRLTKRKMIQNLIWATAYNVITIPLAAGVLYGAGVLIPPAVGALIMSVSTVIVAVNAQLLRLKPLRGTADH